VSHPVCWRGRLATYRRSVSTNRASDSYASMQSLPIRPDAASSEDAHLMLQARQVPTIPAFGDFMALMSIESLRKMGTKFILCNNALEAWCLELEARGKGKMAGILADLKANTLPGVTIVPAMVIAIEKAQVAGIKVQPPVNRQVSRGPSRAARCPVHRIEQRLTFG